MRRRLCLFNGCNGAIENYQSRRIYFVLQKVLDKLSSLIIEIIVYRLIILYNR